MGCLDSIDGRLDDLAVVDVDAAVMVEVVHHAVLGQVVDDQIHELDLVRAESLPIEKPRERFLCGSTIHTDERSYKETEPMRLFRGLAEGLTHGGVENYTGFPADFTFLGQGYLPGGVPAQLPLLLLAGIGFWAMLQRTTIGRGLYAIAGSDAQAGDIKLSAGGGSVSNSAIPDTTVSDGEAFFLGLVDATSGFTSAPGRLPIRG